MNNSNLDSSKIPPARPEIIAEIVAVNCLLADLFLKCQGNVREVDELVGVLENHLASCDNVRDTLLDLRVEKKEPTEVTMTNLPIYEQRMIVSTGLFSKMLLDTIQVISKTDITVLKEKLIEEVNLQTFSFSDAQITQFLSNYLKKHEELVQNTIDSYHIQKTTMKKDKQLLTNCLPSKLIYLASFYCHTYHFIMKAQAQTKHIAELINLGKQQFGDFSEDKKQQIFLTIKEAKVRGLLRKQPYDRCLSEYINVANHLLRSYATDEFTAALNRNLDYIYVYVALVSTNSITVTA
jgi:hypothetical protein